jgi:hypothetical protein
MSDYAEKRRPCVRRSSPVVGKTQPVRARSITTGSNARVAESGTSRSDQVDRSVRYRRGVFPTRLWKN